MIGCCLNRLGLSRFHRLEEIKDAHIVPDEVADELMKLAFSAYHAEVTGRPNGRGGTYRIDMLPTTCHV